jgi:hypothetical protein
LPLLVPTKFIASHQTWTGKDGSQHNGTKMMIQWTGWRFFSSHFLDAKLER